MRRNVQFLYGVSVLQALGIGLTVAGVHAGIVMSATGTAALAARATGILIRNGKEKMCPKCKAFIPKKSRICPACGHRYRDGIPEDRLTEYIEQEKEKEMTSEEIDCDFEKIESVALEELAAYDGDIEAFLQKRGRETDI